MTDICNAPTELTNTTVSEMTTTENNSTEMFPANVTPGLFPDNLVFRYVDGAKTRTWDMSKTYISHTGERTPLTDEEFFHLTGDEKRRNVDFTTAGHYTGLTYQTDPIKSDWAPSPNHGNRVFFTKKTRRDLQFNFEKMCFEFLKNDEFASVIPQHNDLLVGVLEATPSGYRYKVWTVISQQFFRMWAFAHYGTECSLFSKYSPSTIQQYFASKNNLTTANFHKWVEDYTEAGREDEVPNWVDRVFCVQRCESAAREVDNAHLYVVITYLICNIRPTDENIPQNKFLDHKNGKMYPNNFRWRVRGGVEDFVGDFCEKYGIKPGCLGCGTMNEDAYCVSCEECAV